MYIYLWILPINIFLFKDHACIKIAKDTTESALPGFFLQSRRIPFFLKETKTKDLQSPRFQRVLLHRAKCRRPEPVSKVRVRLHEGRQALQILRGTDPHVKLSGFFLLLGGGLPLYENTQRKADRSQAQAFFLCFPACPVHSSFDTKGVVENPREDRGS